MSSMHFIELPSMAICMQNPYILNRWVNIIHVLQAPKPTAYYLCQWEYLFFKLREVLFSANGEEHRNQREPDTSFIVVYARLILQVWHADVFSSIPLIQQAIDSPMELREWTRLGSKTKGNIKGSISSGLNENQMC
jgi:hypothetical protein